MWRILRRRLAALFRKRELERELDEELRFHLEKEIEQNRARGMDPGEARRAALHSFGGVELNRERARDARGVRWLEDLGQDARYGLRTFRKTPGFTAVAVLSLALGIGANATLFSVVDTVLLQTLPVPEPERLVMFEWEAGTAFRNSGTTGYGSRPAPGRRGSSSFHPRIVAALKDQESALSGLVAFASVQMNLVVDGRAELVGAHLVSEDYFEVLGVPAWMGRTLTRGDHQGSAAPAVMLTHGTWQTRLGADPAVVGKTVTINKHPFTIVGVGPPGFRGSLQVDSRPAFFVPIAFEPLLQGRHSMARRPGRTALPWWLHLMGRLKPGATAEQARQSLAGPFRALALEMMPPPQRDDQPARLDPRDEPTLEVRSGAGGMTEARRGYSSTIALLFGVVALVLLIACANVANMLLARAAARRSEVTVRVAMGAGRLRLVRQLLAESLLLALAGGVAGVALAIGGTRLLPAVAAGNKLLPRVDYAINWRVLGFTLAVSLFTGILFGLAPALRATRLDLAGALKQAGRSAGGLARSRLSKTLVVVQVAMSLVLVLGAGLYLRTVHNLGRVSVGFNQENLLVFALRPGTLGYEGSRLQELYRQLFARLDAIPGVRGATFSGIPPLTNMMSTGRVILPGETVRSAANHEANFQVVRENYLATLEIPLVRGRQFTSQDRDGAPPVAIVSEALARTFFPGRDPIGQRLGFDGDPGAEIVGIARDTKYENHRREIAPLVYLSWQQRPRDIDPMFFAVRAAGDPAPITAAIREAVRAVDTSLPLGEVTTQVARSHRTLAPERLRATMLSLFGGIAALLAAIGLYGVMAYWVAQRRGEIGIRMALGAQARGVLELVTWQGLKLALAGVALGLVAAWALRRVVASQLYGVAATDPITWGAAGAALVAVALLASWIPARRATRVDPASALRTE